MSNKRAKQQKPKKQNKASGQKGGSVSYDEIGSPQPVRKKKKKSQ
jgi:hypothetical protein